MALDYLIEPTKRVQLAHSVDVAVVGGGVSGLFAALSAARIGAKTVLIDRFGDLGGNIGPGHLVGGSLSDETHGALQGELPSTANAFIERFKALEGPTRSYPNTSSTVSYLALTMCKEADVELLLSCYASDPILEGQTVCGLFVEGKSGRVAVKAHVVIDATGDASIAERAGAAIIRYVSEDYRSYSCCANHSSLTMHDEAGLYFGLGGFNFEQYREFAQQNQAITDDDHAWASQHLVGRKVGRFPDAMIPMIRHAWETGEFQTVRELKTPDVTISSYGSSPILHNALDPSIAPPGEILLTRASIAAGALDMGRMEHISLVEKELRIQAFETVQFLRKYVPGFSSAYILYISPFLGSRGGPCIDAEHTLTVDETASGQCFADVMFKNYFRKESLRSNWGHTGSDIPYRMLQPRNLENLLAAGRGAGYIQRGHDGAGMMRARPLMMALGQAAGTAAALCARHGVSTRQLDIQVLQEHLLAQGYYLGDEKRLAELGLTANCSKPESKPETRST